MKKTVFSFLATIFCFTTLYSQKTADEFLQQAPIKLPKEVCHMSLAESDQFSEQLRSYNENLFAYINQKSEQIVQVPLTAANADDAIRISQKIIEVSYKYTEKYFCLANLCNSFPELLSGEEIAESTKQADKIKELIEFRNNMSAGKAKESDRPGWHKELLEAENAFCVILSPKYMKVLNDQLLEVKQLLPECRVLGSYTCTGIPDASEIEALRTVHNYLTSYQTNIFLGKMEFIFR